MDAQPAITANELKALTVTDLEALPLSELKACWAAMCNDCFERDRERTRWGGSGRDERDGTYFHLCMKRAVAMLLLLGKHGWRDRPNAISDVRVPVLEYFERANTCALNGQEPRELLFAQYSCQIRPNPNSTTRATPSAHCFTKP
jgi:hypothetical protein